jgi:hypothetical protein
VSYKFPVERPLPVNAFDICAGPFILGSTQTPQYVDRWAVWVATAGIRLGKLSAGMALDDVNGQADDLFPGGTRPSKVSLCFEQAALPVIAIQKDATTIEIRRKVSNVVQSYLFAGLSPMLFYNGVTIVDTSVTDAVCLYIKTAGDKIYARFQRDNYGIEYVINATLAPGAVIKELRKTDHRFIAGVNYQALWGRSLDGRQLYFRSAAYPPLPQNVADKLTNDVALDSGIYFLAITPGGTVTDKITQDSAFNSGQYVSIVINAPTVTDKATQDSAFDSGIYTSIAIAGPAPTDKATEDTAFDSGVYTLTVILSTAPTDKLTTDTGFDSGQYT